MYIVYIPLFTDTSLCYTNLKSILFFDFCQELHIIRNITPTSVHKIVGKVIKLFLFK